MGIQEQQGQCLASALQAEWGRQIRNYVFHPYKMVKDLRSGHETGNTAAVMDGDLDPFMQVGI
jgi:peptide chain release factor 2